MKAGTEIGGPGRDRTDDLFHAMERRKSQLADGKGFNSRMSGQKPLKSACFATKMLPKHVLPICYQTDLGRGLPAGDSPFLDFKLQVTARSEPLRTAGTARLGLRLK
jgi:hypothetical protein